MSCDSGVCLSFLCFYIFGSKLVSSGSEEDLDEEGIGRRAVTTQVAASVPRLFLLLPFQVIRSDRSLAPLLLFPPGEGVRPQGSGGHVRGGTDPEPGGQLEV